MTPCTPRHRHFRLIVLLSAILLCCGALFLICVAVGLQAGWVTFALLAPECLLLTLRTSHVIARYVMYLRSLQPVALNQSNGNFYYKSKSSHVSLQFSLLSGWSPFSYYIDLAVEVICLLLDLAHHVR